MTTTKHTPLPWALTRLDGQNRFDWAIDGGDESGNVTLAGVIDRPISYKRVLSKEECEGNAKLIITAVNHHAELTAALSEITRCLNGLFPPDAATDGDHVDYIARAHSIASTALRNATKP